eukprot:634759-Pelagomonas_calceolata.AAC.1
MEPNAENGQKILFGMGCKKQKREPSMARPGSSAAAIAARPAPPPLGLWEAQAQGRMLLKGRAGARLGARTGVGQGDRGKGRACEAHGGLL